MTLTASFDVANAYMLRGINQDDTGVIMWPAADLGVVVKSGGQGWDRAHDGERRHVEQPAHGRHGYGRPSGKLWYESDFYATFGVGFGGGLRVGAGYVAYTSPNNAFPSMKELSFKP